MDFTGWHFAQTKLRRAKVGHTFDTYCFCCALCKQFSTQESEPIFPSVNPEVW